MFHVDLDEEMFGTCHGKYCFIRYRRGSDSGGYVPIQSGCARTCEQKADYLQLMFCCDFNKCNRHHYYKELAKQFIPLYFVTPTTATFTTFLPTVTSTPSSTPILLTVTPSPTHGESICMMDKLLWNACELYFLWHALSYSCCEPF